MITVKTLKDALALMEFKPKGNLYTLKNVKYDYIVKVDFDKKKIIYPTGLTVNDKTTCNFEHNENFVVLECVCRLLKLGYKKESLELEPKWEATHGYSGGGKADVLVKDNNGDPYLIIECKTWGDEFKKYWDKTELDGDQLFFYAVQQRTTKYLCMYSSELKNKKLIRKSNIISLKDNDAMLATFTAPKTFKDATDKSSLYAAWRDTYGLYKSSYGIFEDDCTPYEVAEKPRNKSNIDPITNDDIQKKFYQFATILRQHNVSGRENAFDKLVNLFLAKIVDEMKNPDKLQFYWGGPQYDDYYRLQDRIQVLYKEGMEEFLGEEVTYIDEATIEDAFRLFINDPDATKDTISKYFKQLKFYSNNDFSFIDVYNERLFYQNSQILVQVIMMLQDIKLVTEKPNQFLGDLFEMFLDDGIKQNEGQYFTPTPIVKFLLSTLPLEEMVGDGSRGPLHVLDYACGAGHFLNEYARRIKEYVPEEKLPDYYGNVLGIEKEYRLSKVAKVSAFMYGQKEIKIIYDDALSKNANVKEGSFDLLVTNPPFSVKGFLETLSDVDRNRYVLSKVIGKSSYATNNVIEGFFIERACQLLKDEGIAIIILPISLLNNPDAVSIKARELVLENFEIISIVELGTKTFGKTGTTTATLFLKKRKSNPAEKDHFKNRVDAWFNDDWSKDDVFKDIESLEKYCEIRGITLDQYKDFINDNSSGDVWSTEPFSVYLENYISSTEWKNYITKDSYQKLSSEEQDLALHKKFYVYCISKEKEKLYFFLLANSNHTPVVIVRSPSSDAELKKFLGYTWKDSKEDAGLKIVGQRGAENNIDKIQTPMFNPTDLNDESKINVLIKNNFLDKELKKLQHTSVRKAAMSIYWPIWRKMKEKNAGQLLLY